VSGVLAVILSAWLSSWAQRRISSSSEPAPSLRSEPALREAKGWQAFSPHVYNYSSVLKNWAGSSFDSSIRSHPFLRFALTSCIIQPLPNTCSVGHKAFLKRFAERFMAEYDGSSSITLSAPMYRLYYLTGQLY